MSRIDSTDPKTEKHRVLVVEEDPKEAEALASLLSDEFDVTKVATAEEAFAALRASSFHVVCSSEAPTGADAITFLRRALSVKEPPCLLMITSEAAMREKQLDGLSGVIMKPYDPAKLLARVKRLSFVAQMRRRVDSMRDAMEKGSDG